MIYSVSSVVFFRETSENSDPDAAPAESESDVQTKVFNTNDLFIKDAFLVLRALCKLTMKPLNTERLATFFVSYDFFGSIFKQRA
jgi:hypothetical protein